MNTAVLQDISLFPSVENYFTILIKFEIYRHGLQKKKGRRFTVMKFARSHFISQRHIWYPVSSLVAWIQGNTISQIINNAHICILVLWEWTGIALAKHIYFKTLQGKKCPLTWLYTHQHTFEIERVNQLERNWTCLLGEIIPILGMSQQQSIR